MSVINSIVSPYLVKYPSADINQVITGLSPDAIKAELATTYQELANATIVITPATDGGAAVLTFRIPSGSKNV